MTFDGGWDDPRVVALRDEQRRRQTRFFLVFALIEGLALLAATVLVYGFELVDPEQGIWILIAIAVAGGIVLSSSLLSMMRRHTQELRDLGVPPGPAPGDPNNAG
ncbi:hypothetical protein OED01_16250 [Microbacterium sp. M28]|uniref:hypothetical protein n=1 Tax=Microbacterium sp. M28 TaxID=2962064 RepID=UPI0021F40BD8|nr:hypothetical protein [Microbacterium sp. M28]UYO97131.1 hypothetical protein OED01_16250 [Microbacterium sp. M28]